MVRHAVACRALEGWYKHTPCLAHGHDDCGAAAGWPTVVDWDPSGSSSGLGMVCHSGKTTCTCTECTDVLPGPGPLAAAGVSAVVEFRPLPRTIGLGLQVGVCKISNAIGNGYVNLKPSVKVDVSVFCNCTL